MKLMIILEGRKSTAEWLLTESVHDPYTEVESNRLTQRLCDWIKTHGKNPSRKKSMLGGTHTASGEVSYNVDPEEIMLADFLQSRKTAKIININFFPTDEGILEENNMPGLFDSRISKRELTSNQKVKALAIEFIKHGEFAKLPPKFKTFLNGKRMAYKDYKMGIKTINMVWYHSDIIVARDNGLPDNWMETIDFEKESNQKVKALAIEYEKHRDFAKLPTKYKNFLNGKRMAYRDYTTKSKSTSIIWYPSDMVVARDSGLPDDWMKTTDFEKESNQKVKALAIRYVELGGKYPPEFMKFLGSRREAYKDFKNDTANTSNIWHPSDIIVARDNGLPDDWMVERKLGGQPRRRDM